MFGVRRKSAVSVWHNSGTRSKSVQCQEGHMNKKWRRLCSVRKEFTVSEELHLQW